MSPVPAVKEGTDLGMDHKLTVIPVPIWPLWFPRLGRSVHLLMACLTPFGRIRTTGDSGGVMVQGRAELWEIRPRRPSPERLEGPHIGSACFVLEKKKASL